MFKDLLEGQTHSYNDGCGCPEHNDMPDKPREEKSLEDNLLWKIIFKHLTPETIQFIKSEISKSYEQGRKDEKERILKGLPEEAPINDEDDCDFGRGNNYCLSKVKDLINK